MVLLRGAKKVMIKVWNGVGGSLTNPFMKTPINIYTCMEYTQISDIYVRLIPGHLFSKREKNKKCPVDGQKQALFWSLNISKTLDVLMQL